MPTLGSFIQRRRIELGLTQEQLGERIGPGVRQAEVSRLENDRITLPRRQRLERIAVALDVPIGELLARSGWAGADQVFQIADAPESSASDERGEAVSETEPTGDNRGRFQAAMARAELQIRRTQQAMLLAQSTVEAAQASVRTHHPGRPNVGE
jgi:transcriptional regulator with XRE-family HTH domain